VKQKLFNVLKFLAFISIGIYLFWKVYKDQPIDELIESAQHVNYWWIGLGLLIGILSHFIRALRWGIALDSMGISARRDNLFHSVMVGYLANLVIPRMGEVSRAAVLKKYNQVPFSSGFGTIVSERIIDLLLLGAATVYVVLFENNIILQFFQNNPAISENVQALLSARNLIIISIVVLVAIIGYLFLMFKKGTEHSLLSKISIKLQTFKEGLFSIFKLNKPLLYILYSILIWLCYYLMLYVSFPAFSFSETMDFGAGAILVVFVLGSYGMVAPVQGGIGAYHFMVISALIIYGLDDSNARLFALIVHVSQTIMLIVVGLISLSVLPLINRKILKEDNNGSIKPDN